jgi:quercetin dioxygenase-like cupin family protein
MKRWVVLLVPMLLAAGVTAGRGAVSGDPVNRRAEPRLPCLYSSAVTAPSPTVHFREVVKRTPIDSRTGAALTPILQGEHATVNVWQLTARIPAHFHREHEEIVIVQEGEGEVRLGEETRRVKAGDVLLIPTNVVHEVIARGNRPFRGISVFSPQFDGKDRVFVGQ